jgi:hypothetical protein
MTPIAGIETTGNITQTPQYSRRGCVSVGVLNMNGSVGRRARDFCNAGDGIMLTGRGVYTQCLGVYTRGWKVYTQTSGDRDHEVLMVSAG